MRKCFKLAVVGLVLTVMCMGAVKFIDHKTENYFVTKMSEKYENFDEFSCGYIWSHGDGMGCVDAFKNQSAIYYLKQLDKNWNYDYVVKD